MRQGRCGLRAHKRDRERGASLVEFAFVAPILFSLLLGMITGGLALATRNSMTNAVREGARLGATLYPESPDDWSDWAEDVRDRVESLAGGDLQQTDICVEMINVGGSPALVGSWLPAGCDWDGDGSFDDDAPTTPASAATGSCIVKVWAATSSELNAMFFQRPLRLEAESLGLYERETCP